MEFQGKNRQQAKKKKKKASYKITNQVFKTVQPLLAMNWRTNSLILIDRYSFKSW